MKIVGKKNTYLLILLVICLLGITLTPSYAKFASGFTTDEDVAAINFSFNLSISNIEEYEEITIDAKSYEIFNIEVTNNTGNTAYYGIWYKMVNPLEVNEEIIIARLNGTETTTSGNINTGESKTVSIVIKNYSNNNIKVNIGVNSSTISTNEIEYLGGKHLVSGTTKSPGVRANAPNLDSGNLIPVYYDENKEVWKKADIRNIDEVWYNYSEKRWANAILIKDSTTRATYQNASANTEISLTDISAFYVWIPKYKYRVWNISRQAGAENTYAYSAYSNGIDISFEEGTASTGNVSCTYNVNAVESTTNLSDTCIYNKTDTITTSSNNKNYTNAWYTHPAFTFGGVAKEGFWIGKFETGGTVESPVILPDQSALVNRTVSEHFTTSKIFQSYGLSSNVDAHMLTNLEWGSVAYLAYSIYGLCDDNGCRDSYINNSSSKYTGRSGGAISGTTALQLNNFYGSSVTTSTVMYNTNGYYNYKGYKIDNSGNITTTKDISKVASTTKNVSGVYDLSGGSHEYVMANMVDTNGAFYPSSSGISWNGSSTLDPKYYNSYSYVNNNNFNLQSAFNIARLGDATAETAGTSGIETSNWKPNVGITGEYSYYVHGSYSWFNRGGNYDKTYAGLFDVNSYYGVGTDTVTFRSVIS